MNNLEEKAALQYTFTEADVQTYLEDYTRTHPLPQKRTWQTLWSHGLYYLLWGGIPFLCLRLAWNQTQNPFLTLIVTIFACSVTTHLLPRFWSGYYRRSLRHAPGFMGEHQVTLSAEGITDKKPFWATTTFWPAIADVLVTKHHLMFVVGTKEAEWILPVPRRIFASDQEFKQFVEQATTYWKQRVSLLAPSRETSAPADGV